MRRTWTRPTRHLLADACGQALTEYALILAGLAALVLLGILVFAGLVGNVFDRSSPESPVLRPPQAAACDPDYSGACIPPPPPRLDCSDLRALGITGVIRVVGSDPQHLDPDHDGIACD